MRKLIIFFMLFELFINNADTLNSSKKSIRKEEAYLIQKQKSHLRKLENISDISDDLYDSTTEYESNLEEIQTEAPSDIPMKESEQNIGFTLLGFAKYIYQNIFKSFSFLIYFRQNNAFPVSKISFYLIIKFAYIRLLQENLE